MQPGFYEKSATGSSYEGVAALAGCEKRLVTLRKDVGEIIQVCGRIGRERGSVESERCSVERGSVEREREVD